MWLSGPNPWTEPYGHLHFIYALFLRKWRIIPPIYLRAGVQANEKKKEVIPENPTAQLVGFSTPLSEVLRIQLWVKDVLMEKQVCEIYPGQTA